MSFFQAMGLYLIKNVIVNKKRRIFLKLTLILQQRSAAKG